MWKFYWWAVLSILFLGESAKMTKTKLEGEKVQVVDGGIIMQIRQVRIVENYWQLLFEIDLEHLQKMLDTIRLKKDSYQRIIETFLLKTSNREEKIISRKTRYERIANISHSFEQSVLAKLYAINRQVEAIMHVTKHRTNVNVQSLIEEQNKTNIAFEDIQKYYLEIIHANIPEEEKTKISSKTYFHIEKDKKSLWLAQNEKISSLNWTLGEIYNIFNRIEDLLINGSKEDKPLYGEYLAASMLELMTHLQILSDYTIEVQRALGLLQLGQIPKLLLPPKELKEILQNIQYFVLKEGYYELPSGLDPIDPLSWYAKLLKASYFILAGNLRINVKIPLVQKNSVFTMYQTFPMATGGLQGVVITMTSTSAYVLVENNRERIISLEKIWIMDVLENGIFKLELTKKGLKRTQNGNSLNCWENIILENRQGIEKTCHWEVSKPSATTEGIIKVSASEVLVSNNVTLDGTCVQDREIPNFPLIISTMSECNLWHKDTNFILKRENRLRSEENTNKLTPLKIKTILPGKLEIFFKEGSKHLVEIWKKNFKEPISWAQMLKDIKQEQEIALSQTEVTLRVIREESIQFNELFLVGCIMGTVCVSLFTLITAWIIYQKSKIQGVRQEVTELQELTITPRQLQMIQEYAEYAGITR